MLFFVVTIFYSIANISSTILHMLYYDRAVYGHYLCWCRDSGDCLTKLPDENTMLLTDLSGQTSGPTHNFPYLQLD